jgi:predicted transposase YbfD/YdcC
MKNFFTDAELAKTCAVHRPTDTGHGRIEERTCRATDATDWLKQRHPDWQNLRSIAAITSRRIDKKTGQTSGETRFYITSLPADPAAILAATRAPWGIENNLRWQLDITFNEDRCRTRKDFRGHCHILQVETDIDRGEARLRHWNRVAGLSPGRQ